ncbi:MAG: hypothetical protein M0R17_01320 [Candidatus Omnitrophica bacterium]|jgi:hypothetical protein|nr:hypothetical protein [Candidatus Omnitrophota bacterium]
MVYNKSFIKIDGVVVKNYSFTYKQVLTCYNKTFLQTNEASALRCKVSPFERLILICDGAKQPSPIKPSVWRIGDEYWQNEFHITFSDIKTGNYIAKFDLEYFYFTPSELNLDMIINADLLKKIKLRAKSFRLNEEILHRLYVRIELYFNNTKANGYIGANEWIMFIAHGAYPVFFKDVKKYNEFLEEILVKSKNGDNSNKYSYFNVTPTILQLFKKYKFVEKAEYVKQ